MSYIIGGLRTPIGKINGSLKTFLPEQLAGFLLEEILLRYNLSSKSIDNVILGNVIGTGGNMARLSLLQAGWDFSCSGITVDAQCGSGLTSISLANALIDSGQADLVVAGGTESSSLAPKKQFNHRDSRFQGEEYFYEQAPFSPDFIGNPDVIKAAQDLADILCIDRAEMDELALSSHQKAAILKKKGFLQDIILPLFVDQKLIQEDDCIKENISIKFLQRLKGVIDKTASITAGNSCLKHDGAAIVLLASKKAIKKYGLCASAKIIKTSSVGNNPIFFPLSPVEAIKKVLSESKLSLNDINAVELNEAFAVKILACCQRLDLQTNKVNLLGGALAYGHPYGASGAIITLHLLKALEYVGGKLGIASIGAVGGLGTAMLIERA